MIASQPLLEPHVPESARLMLRRFCIPLNGVSENLWDGCLHGARVSSSNGLHHKLRGAPWYSEHKLDTALFMRMRGAPQELSVGRNDGSVTGGMRRDVPCIVKAGHDGAWQRCVGTQAADNANTGVLRNQGRKFAGFGLCAGNGSELMQVQPRARHSCLAGRHKTLSDSHRKRLGVWRFLGWWPSHWEHWSCAPTPHAALCTGMCGAGCRRQGECVRRRCIWACGRRRHTGAMK